MMTYFMTKTQNEITLTQVSWFVGVLISALVLKGCVLAPPLPPIANTQWVR